MAAKQVLFRAEARECVLRQAAELTGLQILRGALEHAVTVASVPHSPETGG